MADEPPEELLRPRGTTPPTTAALPDALLQSNPEMADDSRSAILRAAAELLSTRSPSEISLREIAAMAGVNYSLIHRHFRTKDELVLQLLQAFSDYAGGYMRKTDIYSSIRDGFRADPGAFAHIYAWVILDRVDPERVWLDRSIMVDVAQEVTDAWSGKPPAPGRRREFDPRVVAGFIGTIIAAWPFFAPYTQVMANYEDRDPADVRDEIIELLQVMVTAARPATAESDEPTDR